MSQKVNLGAKVFSQKFTRNAKNYLDILCNFYNSIIVAFDPGLEKVKISHYIQPNDISSALHYIKHSANHLKRVIVQYICHELVGT